MMSIDDIIELDERLSKVLKEGNTDKANDALRLISANSEYGLGMAVLAAWRHGLRFGHIPGSRRMERDGESGEVREIDTNPECPYRFVHVPVRQFRSDTPRLMQDGILNRHADPALFVYHEDGLVGTFSFADPGQVGLTEYDLEVILRALANQQVLVRANIDNRQIQFKDLAVKRRIEASGKQMYVRVDREPLDRRRIRLPNYEHPDAWEYVLKSLERRLACNYCSVQTLCPLEVTINSSQAGLVGSLPGQHATVRNYQMGFTFAPVGDPGQVCHFLAWDFPHISDLVMNMEPQAYSFSDLIQLVDGINDNIRQYYAARAISGDPIRISGGCNHWAGNSIYHQHYQLMRIDRIPLIAAAARSVPLVSYQGVEVRKMADAWPAPALLISSAASGNESVMTVADKIAREWRMISEGEDLAYGNEIVIKNHTQNIFVTTGDDDRLLAIFIPRLRQRVSTRFFNGIRKLNAGVLEMLGYFVIDSSRDFQTIEEMAATERSELGDAWLRELSPPPDAVAALEDNVKICLNSDVEVLEKRIDELATQRMADWRTKAHDIVRAIQGMDSDRSAAGHLALSYTQREHLYRELVWALLQPAEGEGVGSSADA